MHNKARNQPGRQIYNEYMNKGFAVVSSPSMSSVHITMHAEHVYL